MGPTPPSAEVLPTPPPPERGRALVTGASAGIGWELARCLAAEGWDLILTARRRERLVELSEQIRDEAGRDALVIPCDLSTPDGAARLARELEERGLWAEILVNNAGFGHHGRFWTMELDRGLDMIQVNVTAVTELAHRLLPPMVEAKRGRILNVASTAAFQPGPNMAVYYASKAYVLSFSEALREELRGTGVTVTALCPGPTRSEFGQQAGFGDSVFLDKLPRPSSRTVAEYGVRALLRGKGVAVEGLLNRMHVFTLRFLPRGLVLRLVRRFQEVRG